MSAHAYFAWSGPATLKHVKRRLEEFKDTARSAELTHVADEADKIVGRIDNLLVVIDLISKQRKIDGTISQEIKVE